MSRDELIERMADAMIDAVRLYDDTPKPRSIINKTLWRIAAEAALGVVEAGT